MSKRSKNKRLKKQKQKKKNAMRIINNNVNNTSTNIQLNDSLYNTTINYIGNNSWKQEQETILMSTQTVKSSATKSRSAKTSSIKTSSTKTSSGKTQPTAAELINNNQQQNAISHLKVSAKRITSASQSTDISDMKSINNAKPKTIPLYVRVAMDLYVNQMPIVDVAKKYNRTRQQIYWINAKSIKQCLPEIWQFGHQQTSKLRLTAEAPRYMQIATSLLNNESIDDIAKKYNKTASYVNRMISISIKYKIPCMYKLIKSRGI